MIRLPDDDALPAHDDLYAWAALCTGSVHGRNCWPITSLLLARDRKRDRARDAADEEDAG